MESFICYNCGEKHKFTTLIEFPEPEIISNISSGKTDKSLDVIAKNFFVIDKSVLICQTEIQIPLKDYDDNLEILIWSKININQLTNIFESNKTKNELKVNAELQNPIPFYDHKNILEVIISVELDKNENAKVVDVVNHSELNQDIKEGIELKKLIKMYSKICKLVT